MVEGRARREFARLPSHVRDRFYKSFAALADNPFLARSGCDVRKLAGEDSTWGLRVGRFRGIYEVQAGVVYFTNFEQRKVAYR